MQRRDVLLAGAALGLALVARPAHAAGGGGAARTTATDPDFRAGVQAWKRGDWAQVQERMSLVVQREPDNADAWNYLGHAARQLGQMDQAFAHYERALQVDPDHRGAHEYVGEAWLMVGNLPKAEEHLRTLDRLCFLPCEPYRELKAKVERYRREHPV